MNPFSKPRPTFVPFPIQSVDHIAMLCSAITAAADALSVPRTELRHLLDIAHDALDYDVLEPNAALIFQFMRNMHDLFVITDDTHDEMQAVLEP